MTISIKPTASGSTIEQDGSTILTVDGSGNITAENNFSATGHVLQVASTTKSDTFSSSANSTWTDITGLSVSITPSSTSNKILVFISIQGVLFRPTLNAVMFRLLRDSTAIGIGDAGGSQNRITLSESTNSTDSFGNASMQYLDSPSSTSALTYKLQFWQDTPANPLYINRTVNDSNVPSHGRGISSITVMEIAG